MRVRTIAVGSGGAAYVVASHWLMTRVPASPWNAVVIVGPMLALLAIYAGSHRQRLLAAVSLAGLAGLLWQGWHGGGIAPTRLYLAQHVVIHAALSALFALTLRPGHESLVTALARRVHDRLTPDMVAYSRKVSIAWTIYFAAMGVLSIVVFLVAPFDVWAGFANFATPVAMLLLFVGEHVLRYRLHPDFERASLASAMRAYSQRDRQPSEPRTR